MSAPTRTVWAWLIGGLLVVLPGAAATADEDLPVTETGPGANDLHLEVDRLAQADQHRAAGSEASAMLFDSRTAQTLAAARDATEELLRKAPDSLFTGTGHTHAHTSLSASMLFAPGKAPVTVAAPSTTGAGPAPAGQPGAWALGSLALLTGAGAVATWLLASRGGQSDG